MPLDDIFAKSVAKASESLDSTREKRDGFIIDVEHQLSEAGVDDILPSASDNSRMRKTINAVEENVHAYIAEKSDPRVQLSYLNTFDITTGVIDFSIEHIAHWWMRADLERKVSKLIFTGMHQFLRGHKDIDEPEKHIHDNLKSYESRQLKDKSITGKVKSEAPTSREGIDINVERRISEGWTRDSLMQGLGLGDFYRTVLRNVNNEAKFLLQQRYLFVTTIRFATAAIGGNFFGLSVQGGSGPITPINWPDASKTANSAARLADLIKTFTTNNTFSLLVRNAMLPNLNGDQAQQLINEFGYMSLPSNRIITDQNEFRIFFLNSQYPILETLMYEWLLQTASDRWLYEQQPFMTADVSITYIDQTFSKSVYVYTFHRCFPRMITTMDPDHDPGAIDISRDMAFSFDYMTIDVKDPNQVIPVNELGAPESLPGSGGGSYSPFNLAIKDQAAPRAPTPSLNYNQPQQPFLDQIIAKITGDRK